VDRLKFTQKKIGKRLSAREVYAWKLMQLESATVELRKEAEAMKRRTSFAAAAFVASNTAS